ncbi:MAG TPA: MaoC family dehydratase [Hyphomonas sp.]|nr:MaoC family dehydratase [Hyphomonas sp.]
MIPVSQIKATAKLRPRGKIFEEFEVGETINHHWGRTITEADAIGFSSLTMSYNPMYFNIECAVEHGHPGLVVNPHLAFNIVLGLSVEDCSEGVAGPFLSVLDLTYHQPVYVGDTLTARSTTVSKRVTDGDQNKGVITWYTEGYNQRAEKVIDFHRSNLSDFAAARRMRGL